MKSTERGRERLLLLGAGVMGAGYLTAAARLDVPVSLVESASFLATTTVEPADAVAVEGQSEEHWYEAAMRACGRVAPTAVVAFSEPHVLAAALVADHYGLPGPGLRAAITSRDKALQRVAFGSHGLRQPIWFLATNVDEACRWAESRLPVVCKPLDRSGSEGVELVDGAERLGELLETRLRCGHLLLEQKIEGPEYSVEALVAQGRVVFQNVTAKTTTGPPYFVELEHRPGALLSHDFQRSVDDMVIRVADRLGMSSGIMHLEFRDHEGVPIIMEVAVRTPGDFIMNSAGAAYGLDLFELVIRLALGDPLDELVRHPLPRLCTCSSFLTAPPGVITEIQGVQEVSKLPGIIRCGVRPSIGHIVRPLRSSLDRVGSVVIEAVSQAQLDERIQQAKSTVKVLTTETGHEVGKAQ